MKEVAICRQPPCGFGKRTIGSIPYEKIIDVCWSNTSSGVSIHTKKAYLYVYFWCTDVTSGVDHSCRHGDAPHYIKACVVKKYTHSKLYNELVKRANKQDVSCEEK
jgi:hypothetical protein